MISDAGLGGGLSLEWLRSHAELFSNRGVSPHCQQDLEIAPLRSLNQASQDLYILASKQSPLKELLTAIARQLTLS